MKNNRNKFSSILISTVFVLIVILSCKTQSEIKETKYINSDPFDFSKNSRICFVGNSITHGGMFHNNIYLFHATRFPDKHISMYNCGVSGDVTWGVLDRMEEDILSNKPTHAVIMLGMNDVDRNWYGSQSTTDIDTLKHRSKVLLDYKKNMEKIVTIFLKKDIKVILERPSIYDQTAILSMKNHFGVNDALGICATFADSLALKYNLKTVDFYGIMNTINAKMQKKDSTFTITSEDRVHPGETGHFVMTYQFLKNKSAPKYISKIQLNINENNIDKCINCEINTISKNKNGITFSIKENALPFPTKKEQERGLELVPFNDRFNIELLQIKGLSTKINYQLKIDNEIIASFSGKQLEKGINLAEYYNTPQYKQSKKVLKILQKLWEIEGKLRGVKFIEYLPVYKKMNDKENLDIVKVFIDSAFVAEGYTDPYYQSEFNKFLQNKPDEEKYKKECDLLRKKVHKMAIPITHIYSLEAK